MRMTERHVVVDVRASDRCRLEVVVGEYLHQHSLPDPLSTRISQVSFCLKTR
jgi:hypothetical protein